MTTRQRSNTEIWVGILILLIIGMIVFYYAYVSQPKPKIDIPMLAKDYGIDRIAFYNAQELPKKIESQFTDDALGDYYKNMVEKVKTLKTEAEILNEIEIDFNNELNAVCTAQGDYHFDRTAYGGIGGCVENSPVNPESPEIQDETLVEQTQQAVEQKKQEILDAEIKSGNVVRTSSGLIFNQSVLTENGKAVYYRGDVVTVMGVIKKELPPPYTYNIMITCCGVSSVRANSHVETNLDGSFSYSFATWSKYPLGEYTAEVSTISSDNKQMLKHVYEFVLKDRR